MPVSGERTPAVSGHSLSALQLLLRSAHLSGPDDLPGLTSLAAAHLGAASAVLYLVDYDQVQLRPIFGPASSDSEMPIPLDGTLPGRAYIDLRQHTTVALLGTTLWTPVLDGAERLGVLELEFGSGVVVGGDLRDACRDVASLLGELIVTRSLCGDAVEKVRRQTPMTVPAEIQWRQLPPLTFVSPRFAVAGVLAPTAEVAGDSFDYALNESRAHVAIIDAMGHGMEATLLSAVAISTLRNARRRGLDLAATVRAIEDEIAAQFGADKFVTGIIGELDVVTGWWRWSSCGHPPALLIRGGSVVKQLDSVIGPPLGLALLEKHPAIGEERLEPGDRLLLYTDGVIEARDSHGDFFGTERLVDLVALQASAERPAAETLRRLNHAILEHQHGTLQDDATTVMIEWLSNEAARVMP
jgi:sigma-B regulation protein RsbU (phosphoserine phosphatase)